MIPGFEWACPGKSQAWCIRKTGAERMLCGRSWFTQDGQPGFCPVIQPIDPQPKCEGCREVMFRDVPARAEVTAELGVCPACGERKPVSGVGRMLPHGGCVGVNLPARKDQR